MAAATLCARSPAKVASIPLNRQLEMVSVFIDELEGMKEGSDEEFRQFAAGQFIFAGSFGFVLNEFLRLSHFGVIVYSRFA